MALSKTRQAVVAGHFYPVSPQNLRDQIKEFIDTDEEKTDALACILPHAGYAYSGKVAVQTVARIKLKKKIILLGPNHTGDGPPYSIMPEGEWVTPLGSVKIDAALAAGILKGSKYLEEDCLAHRQEHSLEVELPILQYFKESFEIVPIVLMADDLKAIKKIGEEITTGIKNSGLQDEVMLVASSDMTHYEPQADAETKDKLAIAAILERDPDKLLRRVLNYKISMCGFAPVIAMLYAANSLGAKSAELIKYETSATVTRDTSSVVGYAGVIIK